jgi:hypothetical protein
MGIRTAEDKYFINGRLFDWRQMTFHVVACQVPFTRRRIFAILRTIIKREYAIRIVIYVPNYLKNICNVLTRLLFDD